MNYIPAQVTGRLEGLALVRVQKDWKYKPARRLADFHSQAMKVTRDMRLGKRQKGCFGYLPVVAPDHTIRV